MRLRLATSASCASCAIVLLTTACGANSEAGKATSSPSQHSSVNTSSSAHYGAPPVPEPLNVKGIIDDPCNAVTDQQIDEFPGTLDSTHTTETTPLSDKKTSCNWAFEGDRYSYGSFVAGVALPRDTFHGLSNTYRANQNGSYDIFKPIEAAGYPAVINSQNDNTDNGDCSMSVGLRDDTVYNITVGLAPEHPDGDQPCKPAKKLASFVVQNLKEGK